MKSLILRFFKLPFLDDTSNYVDNLIAVYNAIALNRLTNNRVYPTIDEKSFIAQMKLRWDLKLIKLD